MVHDNTEGTAGGDAAGAAGAAGVPLTQVGRELELRPEQLRAWARQLAAQDGGLAAVGVVETPEQERRRLRRENAVLREERAFARKVAVGSTDECNTS